MTRVTTALLITALAGGASAGDVYHGFARGNPDLYPHNLTDEGSGRGSQAAPKTGLQPGVGDIGRSAWLPESRAGAYAQSEPFRHYHDWARGNGDLYPENVVGTNMKN